MGCNCHSGLGDFSNYLGPGGGDFTFDPTMQVASSDGGVDWSSILASTVPGAMKTAEQIAIMQTTPAGRYVQTGPGGTSIVYQQPTTGVASSGLLNLPGLSSFGAGLSGTTILLIGGVFLAVMMMKGR